MSPPAPVPAIPTTTQKRLIQLTLIAWLAVVGFDLLMNAGLMAPFNNWQLPGFLPAAKMFQYIPLGYAAFLLNVILLLWLMLRSHVSGARAGAAFGLMFGILMGGSGFLGQMSIFAFPVRMLSCWAVFNTLLFALAGAVIGSGIAAARLRPLVYRVLALVLICIVVSLVMQNLGFVPAQTIQGGRIGNGSESNR